MWWKSERLYVVSIDARCHPGMDQMQKDEDLDDIVEFSPERMMPTADQELALRGINPKTSGEWRGDGGFGDIGEKKYPMTRRGRKGNQESDSDSDSDGETFLRKGEMKERPNAICKTIDASTAVFDRYDEDCRWRGEEKRKAFAKAKAERASGASLILPNMGCTRQVFWRHLGGWYPFFSLFLLPLLFLKWLIWIFVQLLFRLCFFCFFFSYFIAFAIFCKSLHLHLSSNPPLSHWVPTSELPLDKNQNLLHIPLHPCHRIGWFLSGQDMYNMYYTYASGDDRCQTL